MAHLRRCNAALDPDLLLGRLKLIGQDFFNSPLEDLSLSFVEPAFVLLASPQTRVLDDAKGLAGNGMHVLSVISVENGERRGKVFFPHRRHESRYRQNASLP